jgi:hypothetical protein
MRQKISFAMNPAGAAEERWVRLPSIDVALQALEELPAARWDDCWPAQIIDSK